ncbi:MAG: isocitrate lyase/phosphoenolpyruvate mutase family protein [Planctomycetota bacterium]|nr:isocitrate lyase/phosphoenolpyruvate mutase family protein [Planctomycetota bacterium]
MNDHLNTVHPGSRLRSLMKQGTVVAPGAFNALVACAVARAGFSACYISGGATANVAGYPDVGLITMTEMTRTIREVSDASGLPVIADADTGFGEVECAIRTVVEYERVGAAALHIEDQVFPKRCGHLDGKEIISAQAMADKISAMAKHRISPDFVLIARTDARAIEGMDGTIRRANLYREAGADVIFPEGLADASEFKAFAHASPGHSLANMTEFGKTQHISVSEFGALGYSIVIFPLSLMRIAMNAVEEGLDCLKKQGSLESMLPKMQTRKDLYSLLGYTPGTQWNSPRSHQ